MWADFDEQMSQALSVQALGDAWTQVVGAVGTLEHCGEPFARRFGEHTVVDLPMAFEAGDMVGRLTLHPDLRITGLFVLTPEAARSL